MRFLLLVGLLALLAAPQSMAQAPGHGERVDVTAAEYPPLAVGDHTFYINVTLHNKQAVEATVLLSSTLYDGAPGAPCDGGRFNQTISAFQKSVTLAPGTVARVEGNASFWGQVVNGSRATDGAHEACVWARMAQCPTGEPLQACYLDYESQPLEVRAHNAPPTLAPRAEPTRGATGTTFTFDAGSGDADGDAVAVTWAFGDGTTAQGARVQHRFARAGANAVTTEAWDGFDAAQAMLAVQVDAGASPGSATPGAPLPWMAVAAGLAALALRRR